MTLIEEIHTFARDFINDKSTRTISRKKKIREAFKQLTGKNVVISCSTCYLEALFEIINTTKMATPKGYELKLGATLEAFGHPEKFCTNNELTDELAEWHLKENPGQIIWFSKVPATNQKLTPEVVIIPPKKEVKEDVGDMAEDLIAKATLPPKKTAKTKK